MNVLKNNTLTVAHPDKDEKIFFGEHWKLSWDFQGELLGEPHDRLLWICGVMEQNDKSPG